MKPLHFVVRNFCWLTALLAGLTVCADEADVQADLEFFERHVRPILIKHCYACHSTGTDRREGGLLLDSRAGWAAGGDSGQAISPGDPDASLLVSAIRYDSDLQMPPDRKLPSAVIGRLEQWVRRGAPDPREGSPGDSENSGSKHSVDPSDPIAGREYWAYQPLRETQPPRVMSSDWPRGAIDAFILAGLEKVNLNPASDADKRLLLRRLFVQLVGLLPTQEQLDDFLRDGRPDALERLVDQLLSSPHFGERWGRHWLDLARYADSNGLDENFLFREAWRYRNWVIRAVNADMPFDRFLCQQIAGDQLPFDSIEQRDSQRIAAGFMVLGPKVLLGNDPNERVMDVADEQLDTIGRAVLGQTMGCARCHDHKFDPIPTADYYALAGILTSTQVLQQRHMLNQQRLMERLVGLGSEGDQLNAAYEAYWREQPQVKEQHKQAKAALALLTKQDATAFEAHALQHPTSVADQAADVREAADVRVTAQEALVKKLGEVLANPPEIPPRAMIPSDVELPGDEAIRIAGQFDRPGARVPRGFLTVLSAEEAHISSDTSGRVELAKWLTDVDRGAGHLAARVLANRVWYQMMGCGLVRTLDNFGRTGEGPSHPELLDYLARELIDSGWSIKHLVRRIALSRTFAMSSCHHEVAHELDPENRLYWRANRRRLEPEALRDGMLLAADALDLAPMESTVWYLGDQATAVGANKNRRRTDFPCRSVYLPIIRNDLPELFDVFDFANPHATTGMRPQTMVASQSLFLMNDESVMNAAEATAKRFMLAGHPENAAEILEPMFEAILSMPPTDAERAEMLAFVNEIRAQLTANGVEDVELRAWSMCCQAIFASSRFQVLE